MPVSKFSEANRDECLEHLLEAGNQLASVLRVLRHSRFESEKPLEVFAEAIAVLENINTLKNTIDSIDIESE